MDLQNMHKHMKGQSVSVNGNVYAIDMKGIAHKVKAKDAEKLMKGKAWDVVGSEPDETESPFLDDDGKPVTEPEPESEPELEPHPELEMTEGEPEMDIKELKAMADELNVSYGPNIGAALLQERIEKATTKDPG